MRTSVAILAIAIGLTPRAAAAQSEFQVPDSARLVRLSDQLQDHHRVRVVVIDTPLILTEPRVSAEGIDGQGEPARRRFSYQSAAADDRGAPRLGWARIRSIEVRDSGANHGALIGGLLGLLGGLAVSATQPCQRGFIGFGDSDCVGRKLIPVLVGPMAGVALGALIGNRLDPWRRIYP